MPVNVEAERRIEASDGLVAHDVFDLGPDGEDETRTFSTTVVALCAGQIRPVAVPDG